MAGLDADTSVYALSRPQGQTASPLQMMGQFASVQGQMNQNALFTQEFRAKQALGPIAQGSVDPKTGQMDWGKFAVGVASDPNAAFLAPQIIQSIAQKQLLDQQTISAKLDNANKMFNSYASALGTLLPLGDNISTKDIIGAVNQLHAQGSVDDEHLMQFLGNMPAEDAKVSVPLPTGQVVQRSALAQYISQQARMAGLRAESMSSVIPKLVGTDTGSSTVFTQQTPFTGEVQPASGPGAVIAHGPTPTQANETIPTYNAQTRQYENTPRYQVAPMLDSSGHQAYNSGAAAGAAPTAASGPSVSKPGPFEQTYQTDVGSKMADYADGVNQGAHAAQQSLQTLDKQLTLLKNFRAGGGTEYRQEVAQMMQGVGNVLGGKLKGAMDDLADKVVGGGPGALAAAQEFEKYAAISAMQSLVSAQGSHYRPAAVEYTTMFKNYPRTGVDPKASRDMLMLTRHLLQQNVYEQLAMEKFRQEKGDGAMERWPSTWTKILAKNGWLGSDKSLYQGLGGKNWDTVNGAVTSGQ